MTKYKVTREFIAGVLKGITHTEITTVKFNIGFICNNPIGNSPYKIIDCTEVITA